MQELRIAFALAEQEVEGGLSARISPLAQVSSEPLGSAFHLVIEEFAKL